MFAVASGCAAAEWGAGRKDAKVAVVSSRPGSRERVNNAGGKVGYVSGSQQQHHVARARALRQECTDLICVGYVLARKFEIGRASCRERVMIGVVVGSA